MNDPARPDTAERVMDTLAYVGTNGLPHLIAFLNNPAHPHRGSAAVAMSALCKLGPNARPAIPALIQCLQDPDPIVASRAAHTLSVLALVSASVGLPLKLESASVVSALKSALSSSDPAVRACSAGALIAFREQAADTLPSLTNLLADPERLVRAAASNAIFHLHTPLGTVVPPNAPAR
jgi:HEAT repeat protein